MVAICLPMLANAQQITTATSGAAYQQVRDTPFQRTLLTKLAQEIPYAPIVENQSHLTTASLISPVSNHKNAITTSYLANEIEESGNTDDQNAQASPTQSAHVVVQPPLVQPYKNNQYSFVIENRGTLDADDVSIEISVDENSRIVAMLPSEAVVTDEKALLTIKKLHAGEHYNVHLTATSATEQPIVFQAKLVHSSVQSFGAQPGTTQITVGSTMQRQTTSARPYTMSELPSSTEREVPIVSGKKDYEPRPHFQTNPHYQGEQNGKQLPVRSLYTTSPAARNSTGDFRVSVGTGSTPAPKVDNSASTIPSTPEDFSPIESDFIGMPTVNDELKEEAFAVDQPPVPFTGPRNMEQLATREFSLSIANPTNQNVNDVFVQLKVPEGLEIMTFDRQTWYDEVSRTISFKIPAIAAEESETIHYQLKATGSGFQIQKLVVEAEGLEHPEIRFDTFIQD